MIIISVQQFADAHHLCLYQCAIMELVEPWWSPVLRSGKYFLAGTVAGTSDCLLNYPFDTVKSRLQTSPHHPLPGSISSSFTGPRDCFQRTVQVCVLISNFD